MPEDTRLSNASDIPEESEEQHSFMPYSSPQRQSKSMTIHTRLQNPSTFPYKAHLDEINLQQVDTRSTSISEIKPEENRKELEEILRTKRRRTRKQLRFTPIAIVEVEKNSIVIVPEAPAPFDNDPLFSLQDEILNSENLLARHRSE